MADEDSVDTVTPLDGDGHNVTYPVPFGGTEGDRVADQFDNVKQEDYETRGRTTVATPYGYAFVSSDTDLPVITHEGTKMTAEQAEAVVAESDAINGKAYVVAEQEDEEV